MPFCFLISLDFLTASVSFYFSQSLSVRLEQLNSEATLSFNHFSLTQFFSTPTHFMRFLIISSSLHSLSLFPALRLSSTSAFPLCHRQPAAPLTSDDLFRERLKDGPKRNSTEVQRHQAQWYRVPSRPLSLLLSILLVCIKSHHRSQCKCVYLCNFHKLKVSLKWRPRGWWSVALPSSLCCQPPGDHTSTHVHRDNFTHTPACSQSHSDTDACTSPLLGSSVPEACLCLSRPPHKLDFSF